MAETGAADNLTTEIAAETEASDNVTAVTEMTAETEASDNQTAVTEAPEIPAQVTVRSATPEPTPGTSTGVTIEAEVQILSHRVSSLAIL